MYAFGFAGFFGRAGGVPSGTIQADVFGALGFGADLLAFIFVFQTRSQREALIQVALSGASISTSSPIRFPV